MTGMLVDLRCAGQDGARRCWRPVARVAATIALCQKHLDAIIADLSDPLSRVALTTEQAPALTAVVYYIGDPAAQLVKIGTTTSMRHRINDIRSQRPGSVLLATEPGGYPVERSRHREFAGARCVSTSEREWFAKVPALMGHIGTVRRRHGILSPGPHPVPPRMIAPLRLCT